MAIGLPPSEVKACSLWEFFKALEGWRAVNVTEEETKAPSEDRFYERMAELGIDPDA